MGNGHALGGAGESGRSGLLSKDAHTSALGSQGAAGSGLGSPLGGDLLFKLLVFPGILGSPLPLTGLMLGPVKPLIEMDPWGGGRPSWQVANAKPLCHRVTGGTAEGLGSGGIREGDGEVTTVPQAGH